MALWLGVGNRHARGKTRKMGPGDRAHWSGAGVQASPVTGQRPGPHSFPVAGLFKSQSITADGSAAVGSCASVFCVGASLWASGGVGGICRDLTLSFFGAGVLFLSGGTFFSCGSGGAASITGIFGGGISSGGGEAVSTTPLVDSSVTAGPGTWTSTGFGSGAGA